MDPSFYYSYFSSVRHTGRLCTANLQMTPVYGFVGRISASRAER